MILINEIFLVLVTFSLSRLAVILWLWRNQILWSVINLVWGYKNFSWLYPFFLLILSLLNLFLKLKEHHKQKCCRRSLKSQVLCNQLAFVRSSFWADLVQENVNVLWVSLTKSSHFDLKTDFDLWIRQKMSTKYFHYPECRVETPIFI